MTSLTVRVKTWEELLATPGAKVDEDGDIYRDGSFFVQGMVEYCGKIISAEMDTFEDYHHDGWYFAKWMIYQKDENFNSLYEKLL